MKRNPTNAPRDPVGLGVGRCRNLTKESLPMKLKSTVKQVLLTALLVGTAGILSAQTPSAIITFSVNEATNIANGTFNPPPPAGTGTDAVYARGTFNGWGAYLQLVQAGASTVYTNTASDTVDTNGGNLSYIYHDTQNGDEGPADWANRTVYIPTNSGASIVLPTAYFGDVGPASAAKIKFQVDMSEEIELGHFHPATGDTVVIAGSFQGWSPSAGIPWVLTNDPTIRVTNNNFTPPVIESNVYTAVETVTLNARYSGVAATNCAENFKYVEMPGYNWDSPIYPNSDSGGNRFFTEFSQTLPLVSFNDTPYAPEAQVTLNLDMSTVIKYDPYYVPGSVAVWGTFNGWAAGIPLTNNPAAANPNLFTAVTPMGEGASLIYQFRYTNSFLNGWVYDYSSDQVYNDSDRRTLTLPITATVLYTNLPTVYFNDLAPNDVLPVATPVQFTVNMTGAVETNGNSFSTSADGLYINGGFANYGGYPGAWYPWAGGANLEIAPAGFEMTQVGSSEIYTNIMVLPAGTPVALSYQYGADPNQDNQGPVENEALSGADHYRVVRSTAFSPYVLPTDTFTNQPYEEPIFSTGNIGGVGSLAEGNLSVGPVTGGKVAVTWLGRPGAQLQVGTNLVRGTWRSLPATDGTNWVSGYSSTNGFVSQTNWPAGSNSFFRLIKP